MFNYWSLSVVIVSAALDKCDVDSGGCEQTQRHNEHVHTALALVS